MASMGELEQVLGRLEHEDDLSGALVIAQRGEVVFEKAYGFASRQLSVPNQLDTRFHIASVSKMLIAMAALILSEQGLIALHEQPAAYLPELAALDRDITLHHLLSHTSGLQDVYDVANLRFAMSKLKQDGGSLVSYLVQLPLVFRPGTGWSYSSTGYLLLGYLMEHVSGLSFDALMKRYVLTPLSMTNTGLDLPRKINPGRAYGHTDEHGELVNAENDELSDFEGPGELYSTVLDLKKWCDALFDCPLVSPQTLQLMFTPHGQVSPSTQYGYGWFLGPRSRWHGGGTPGFLSRIRQYPEQQASIVLLCNSDQVSVEALLSALEPHILE
jgi:CubicO group peptidase (beta-lactamase class C family)